MIENLPSGPLSVSVFGTYRSGTQALGQILERLGVDMGSPFKPASNAPLDLSRSLERWWPLPDLENIETASNRVHVLRQWRDSRISTLGAGCAHPLLTLSASDLLHAWGKGTKFFWVHRSLEEAIASLERQNIASSRAIQSKLYAAADEFFSKHEVCVIQFDDIVANPERVISRVVDLLHLQPTLQQLADAASCVHRRGSRPAGPSSQTGRTPRIAASIITGNRPTSFAECLTSIGSRTDAVILIDTGEDTDDLSFAMNALGARLKVVKHSPDSDRYKLCNSIVEAASMLGCEWLLLIDSDESLVLEPDSAIAALRDRLQNHPGVDAWAVWSDDKTHLRDRLIRTGVEVQWSSVSHPIAAALTSDGQRGVLNGISFVRRSLPEAEFMEQSLRKISALRTEIRDNPEDANLWYLLGETLGGTDQHEGAIYAYDRCIALQPSEELAAWASYRSAQSMASIQRLQEAIERCAVGLAIDANFPELAWMAAQCLLELDEIEQAILWSEMAMGIGCFRGIGRPEVRTMFRDLVGWYEGPIEVQKSCYARLGDHRRSNELSAKAETARNERLNGH